MEKFSDWLMQELRSRNMSQSDLSRSSNITTAQISRIISGQRNPGQDTLSAIAKAFKLPPEFVFEKAGILPPSVEDPWVSKMNHKLELLTGPRREMAERILDTMLSEQDRETREVKPARI